MTREAARSLWGTDVIERALSATDAEPVTRELAQLVEKQADELRDDAAVARWALSLPWPRFCAVVRIVAGVAREELLDE